jgi:hypothetical protein
LRAEFGRYFWWQGDKKLLRVNEGVSGPFVERAAIDRSALSARHGLS